MLLSTLLATESAVGPTLAIIVGVGMAAQWIAWRSQIPSIILLLVAGLLLGPVFSVIDPDAFLGGTLFPIVSLSVALILFAPLAFGYLLAPLGLVASTMALVVLGAMAGNEFRWREVLLLGAGLTAFATLVFVHGLGLLFPLWPAVLR